jgi:hypothetical protein
VSEIGRWKVFRESRYRTEVLDHNAADALAAERRRVAGLVALLKRCMDYLDYMEDRGYSSVRMLRSEVFDAIGRPLSAAEEALSAASDGADATAHAAPAEGEG